MLLHLESPPSWQKCLIPVCRSGGTLRDGVYTVGPYLGFGDVSINMILYRGDGNFWILLELSRIRPVVTGSSSDSDFGDWFSGVLRLGESSSVFLNSPLKSFSPVRSLRRTDLSLEFRSRVECRSSV